MAIIEVEKWDDAWDKIQSRSYSLDDIFEKNGACFCAKHLFNPVDTGIDGARRCEILGEMAEANLHFDDYSVKKALQAEHTGKLSKFIKKYPICGSLPVKRKCSEETVSHLSELFKDTFNGRVPHIIKGVASVCEFYKLNPEELVKSFDVSVVQDARRAGLCEAEAVLISYTLGDKGHGIAKNPVNARVFLKMMSKALQERDETTKNAALWIAYHADTKESVVKKVSEHADTLNLAYDTPVSAVKAALSQEKGLSEIERIEKRYKKPGFKISECVFDLRFSEVSLGKYTAKILEPHEVNRMVMLGYDTACCQKLDDVGESAMMHGLLNPHAGFFVVLESSSNRVVAQAEVWETQDRSELVFDNIEFANDAELSLYWPVIKKWLEETTYPTVTMGVGYNTLSGSFPTCEEPRKPWVTPREVHVISYEEESEAPIFKSVEEADAALRAGDVTYYDYVYCDSENRAEYLKKNGVVQEYVANENTMDDPDQEEYYEPEEEY